MTKRWAFFWWLLILGAMSRGAEGLIAEVEYIGLILFLGIFFLICAVEEQGKVNFGTCEITRLADEIKKLRGKKK